eukprot:332991-Pleurochrysis_carterae.AAC.1
MVVLGLREAIFQQLPGGLLVPKTSCSGVTVEVAHLDNHLAPIQAVLAVPLRHAGVHSLVGWPLSLRVGLINVAALQLEVVLGSECKHKGGAWWCA